MTKKTSPKAAKTTVATESGAEGELITTSVVFRPEVYAECQRRAEAEERSVSQVVNRALKAHFEGTTEAAS